MVPNSHKFAYTQIPHYSLVHLNFSKYRKSLLVGQFFVSKIFVFWKVSSNQMFLFNSSIYSFPSNHFKHRNNHSGLFYKPMLLFCGKKGFATIKSFFTEYLGNPENSCPFTKYYFMLHWNFSWYIKTR